MNHPEPFNLDLTEEELVEDLCWPNRPPGQWDVPRGGRDTVHIDRLLVATERELWPRKAA